jgi:micrococcal nuclease
MTRRDLKMVALGLLLATALFTRDLAFPNDSQQAAIGDATGTPLPDGFVRVSEAVDGDTIVIEGGARVRYIGVDTPETVHPSKPVQCFGREASDFNKSMVEGRAVRLERDLSDTDTYGRLLRYVYLEDGTFVNHALVAGGYAYASTYPPDIAHAADFAAAMAAAREAHTGLWAGCPVPAKYR